MMRKVLALCVVLVCVIALAMPIFAEDLIKNGTFDNDQNWEFWAGNGGSATLAVENGEAKISVDSIGQETWSVQFKQESIPYIKGQTYVIKFDARSTIARTIQIIPEESGGSYAKYFGPQDVNITTTMATYTYEFTMKDATNKSAHLVFCLGAVGKLIGKPHTVFIDNVSVTVKP